MRRARALPASILSFNGNKIVTTGGGGAIVTNDHELAREAKHLDDYCQIAAPLGIRARQRGWNYRLPNINAALGLAQLEQLDAFLAAKRALARRYGEAFARMPGVRWVKEPEGY